MNLKNSKPLQRLSNKEFLGDIKKYIKNTHEFYTHKVPEMNILADRLHQEYTLNDFYKVFNKLWQSGSQNDRTLAIHTLELYYADFNLTTWQNLKQKLSSIKSIDEVDHIGKIISLIYRRENALREDIFKLATQSTIWLRRIALYSLYHLIKQKEIKDFHFVIKCVIANLDDTDEEVQEVLGFIIRELGKLKKESVKRFILKHMSMPKRTFGIATEQMKELRKMRRLKKLTNVHVV